ncbi:alpha/beta hydrolase [Actinoplanes sp. NPDC026670]|uniref:alpha/beta hydrolase n=1 Tax=Actinoplanes sp. NPDC026670 TaxID=3154700 RepID=UPI0033EDCACD
MVAIRPTVELRVHGVGGASPDELLGTTAHRQVWGDRIAGFYAADGEVRGRRVEAYCWGGMTSRSSARVLWLLLFPFMLANVAGWTCSARVRRDRWMFAAHRACGRLAALAVTLNLLLIAAMAAMDVWAYQFSGRPLPGSALWIERVLHLPAGLRPGQRIVIGAGLVLANLLVIALLAERTRSRYEDVLPASAPTRKPMWGSAAAQPDGVADPRFYDGQTTAWRLARLHLSAGVAWLALLLAWIGGGEQLDTWTVKLAAATLLITIVLIACEVTGNRLTLLLTGAAPLVAVVVAVWVWRQSTIGEVPGHLPGMLAAVRATFALIGGLMAARVLLMPLIVLLRRLGFRRGVVDGPPADRKWRAAPFVVAVLSVVSINAVGLGSLIAIGQGLGSVVWTFDLLAASVEPVDPADLADGLAMFPVLRVVGPWLTLAPAAVVAVFLLVELARWVLAGRDRSTGPIVAEYTGRSDAGPAPEPPWDVWRRSALPAPGMSPFCRRRAVRWVRSIARARKSATYSADVRYLAAGVALVALLFPALYLREAPWFPTFAENLAVSLAVMTPSAGVVLLRWGWRRPGARRWLGVLWDVGTFWPRAFHPFAPPCYAERAVPDLQRRIRWLRDNGNQVVLVGHSQGSVLAATALAQQPDPDTVLVTFGSPLTTLYGWGFPAYINADLCGRIKGEWVNFSYRTDYIGGPVGCGGVDIPLPDPATSWHIAGEPLPPMRRHTGYWSDDAMWAHIDETVAKRLADIPAPARPGPADSVTPVGPGPAGPATPVMPGPADSAMPVMPGPVDTAMPVVPGPAGSAMPVVPGAEHSTSPVTPGPARSPV